MTFCFTIAGSTAAAIAAEHPLAAHAAKSNPKLAAFIDDTQTRPRAASDGVHGFVILRPMCAAEVSVILVAARAREFYGDAVFVQEIPPGGRALTANALFDAAIPAVARDFANDAMLLCLDEFQVTDVADAAILAATHEKARSAIFE